MTDGTSVPAGWYPAPHANGEQRYWDGAQWNDMTPEQANAAHAATVAAAQPTAAYPAAAEPTAAYPAAAQVAAPAGVAVAEQPGAQPPVKRKGLKWWAWVLIGFGALVLLIIIVGSLSGGRGGDDDAAPASQPKPSAVVEEEPEEEDTRVDTPDVVGKTVAEARTALEGAGMVVKLVDGTGEDWIVTSQTISVPAEPGTEVMIVALAPKPVLTMGQEQAVKKGESYLQLMGFSRSGLIEQLTFEGFAVEDATFAADHIAPDWNAEAAEKAESYIDLMAFSREGLIEQLMFEGFDQAQAEFGATSVGY